MQPTPTSVVAPFPDNEERRLATLADYALLDTTDEEVFDTLARLAAQVCRMPIALIGLIDRDRQWITSSLGLGGVRELARNDAFCAHTILDGELMEISDVRLDKRFADNPLVRGYPFVRFYAGLPLIVASGDALGTLCVLDREPRSLSADQRTVLKTIAAAIVEQFERRRAYARLYQRSGAEFFEVDAVSGALLRTSVVACNNSGYSLVELRKLSLGDLLPSLIPPNTFADFMTGLRAERECQPRQRTRLRRKDGTTYLIDFVFEVSNAVSGDRLLVLGSAVPADAADDASKAPSLDVQNSRLMTLTAVARDLLDALDARRLVEALVRGIGELTGGGSVQLLTRASDGSFMRTRDLAARPDAPLGADDFLFAAALQSAVWLAPDGSRAAVPILAPSGTLAYMVDIRPLERPFVAADAFAFELLGQYLAVAIRNVEIYRELESRRSAIVELNQVKNDLIAMLAHDFKGPLTTIVGLADVLAEDERFDAESRRFLGLINSSAMRLSNLASDTLTLSRLEQNELSLRFEAVDMVALVRDIVRVFSVTRSIVLRCAVSESIVSADPARLRQVFENLIGNAIKYSPGGETVGVTLREKRGGVEVAIRDRGIGIRAADIPKLFGRFARGSNARELGIGGTGFGLYLSRTIVDRHGGQITLDSKEGSGATFRVLVPALPARQRTRDRRILLLDNEDDGRSYIAHALRDEGYAVYPVANENELVQALDDGRYDAAIVDVDRLAVPQHELVARIARRTTLVRLVSAAEPAAAGANATLRKPFLIKDLQAVVEAAVAERRRGPRRSGGDR